MNKEIKKVVIEFEDGSKEEIEKALVVKVVSNDITATLDYGIKDLNDDDIKAIAYDLNRVCK